MTKSPKAFRLSEQALESLSWLVSETGTNETAIVEMSLAFLKRSLQNQKAEPIPLSIGDLVSDLPVTSVISSVLPVSGKRKRKRH